MAPKDKKNELAKNEGGALAMPGGFDYGEDAGSGWENTGQGDFTIPFLTVLQAMSPECTEGDAAYNEAARPGMLMDSATKRLWDGKEGLEFVPAYTEHLYVEWRNRQTDGGGFIGVHPIDAPVVAEAIAAAKSYGKYVVPVEGSNPHDLVESFYMYGLIVDGEDIVTPCMISFSSTKIKAYKGIMTPLRHVKGKPPLFAFRLKITTVTEKNSKGTFHNFKLVPANGDAIASLIDPTSPIFLAGKEFKNQVAEGKAKIDHAGGREGETADNGPTPF
jgi:hypothetical protein